MLEWYCLESFKLDLKKLKKWKMKDKIKKQIYILTILGTIVFIGWIIFLGISIKNILPILQITN